MLASFIVQTGMNARDMTTVAVPRTTFLKRHAMLIVVVIVAVVFPFLVGLLEGQSPLDVIASEGGNAKFLMGLAI